MSQEPFEDRMAILVSRYATPLAIALVSMGIILAQPQGGTRDIVIGLLFWGIFFNHFILSFIKRDGPGCWFIKLRLLVNLATNTLMVYFLGSHWPPIWLLLALTPIATAIYSSKARTMLAAGAVSAILLVLHALRGPHSAMGWGTEAAQAAFIVLLSLLINELSVHARAHEHSATGPVLQK